MMISNDGISIQIHAGTVAHYGLIDVDNVFSAMNCPLVYSQWKFRDLSSSSVTREPWLKPGPWHDAYVLVVDSVAQAREILPFLKVEGMANEIVLAIRQWGDASVEVLPISTSISSARNVELIAPSHNSRYTLLHGKFSEWKNIYQFVAEVVASSANVRRWLPWGGLRVGVSSSTGLAWALSDGLARWTDPETEMTQIQTVESVDRLIADRDLPHIMGDQQPEPKLFSGSVIPPVDPAIYSPSGFETFPQFGTLLIRDIAGDRWILEFEEKQVGDAFCALNEQIIAEIRKYESVRIELSGTSTTWEVARMISQLAICGVLMNVDDFSDKIADLVGPEITGLIRAPLEHSLDTDIRESRSIDLRRAGMRCFLPQRRLEFLGLKSVVPEFSSPTVSIILASRRPSYIQRILGQIARQTYSTVETILAIHGHQELSPSVQLAIDTFPGRIRVLHFGKKIFLGDVLNGACLQAEGNLLTKMDDDDWYAPHHIEDLVLSRLHSGAGLVGSPVEFSYLEGPDITTRRNHRGECYANHIAGGTLMISRADFSDIGGWRSVRTAVDRGLIDAAMASGMEVYRSHGQNYVMNRRSNIDIDNRHTWDANYSVFLRDVLEQWDGLVLPPQFNHPPERIGSRQRAKDYRSIFSR